jgi:hypothetical protein
MDALPGDPEALRLSRHRGLLWANACTLSATWAVSTARVPYGLGFPSATDPEVL